MSYSNLSIRISRGGPYVDCWMVTVSSDLHVHTAVPIYHSHHLDQALKVVNVFVELGYNDLTEKAVYGLPKKKTKAWPRKITKPGSDHATTPRYSHRRRQQRSA